MSEAISTPWNPEDVTDVCITLRSVIPLDQTKAQHRHTITGMQFREQYVAVVVGNGRAFIYPYGLIESIETISGNAQPSREESIAQYRAMTKGEQHVETDLPEGAGATES